MARHEVVVSIPEVELGATDVEFTVRQDGAKLGTLKISKGSVVWVPKVHTFGYRIAWKELDTLLREHGRKENSVSGSGGRRGPGRKRGGETDGVRDEPAGTGSGQAT